MTRLRSSSNVLHLVVAANIRRLAREHHVTQTDLAAELGLDASGLSRRWWGDDRTWQVWELAEVARVLHVTPADLVTESLGEPLLVPPRDRQARISARRYTSAGPGQGALLGADAVTA